MISSTSAPDLNTFGQQGFLTDAQTEALNQIKKNCPPEHIASAKFTAESVDGACLRFLRARQFDITRTLALLDEAYRKKIECRVAEKILKTPDENARCDISIMKNWYPHSMPGYDKRNRPILFENSGGITPSMLAILTTRENMVDYHWWVMEVALDKAFSDAAERAVALGIPMSFSTCVVMDFTGLNSSHMSSKMLDHVKSLVQIDNVCYPELLGKLIVVNAPWITVGLWNLVKGWLDPRTQAKIEIMSAGTDSSAKLMEYIDSDKLPQSFGGTGPPFFVPRPDVESVVVPRQGHWRKTVHIPSKHSLVVDSYIGEGIVEFVAACVETLEPQHHHGMPKNVLASSSISGGGHHTHGECLTRKVLTGDGQVPDRFTYFCPVAETNRIVVLSWNNSSRFSTRNIIFSVKCSEVIEAESNQAVAASEEILSPHPHSSADRDDTNQL